MVKDVFSDYVQKLSVAIRDENCRAANELLGRLCKEPDAVRVIEVLDKLRAFEATNLIVCLSSFIAHFGSYADDFPVVEEILFEKILAAPERLEQLLTATSDPREVACYVRCIERLVLESAAPALENKLGSLADEDLIIDSLNALASIGYCDYPQNIADYLYSANRKIIVAAIRCLGSVGDTEALHILNERMGTDSEFDYLVLDQFAKVQDQYAIARLNDTLASHTTHVRNYGKAKLGAIGAKAIPALLENLHSPNTDLVVHSLNVLGDIKDENAVKSIRNLLHEHPEDANVRFAAYETLGMLPCRKIAYALAEGLHDQDDSVRTAAARAINNNYTKILGVGVKNLLRSSVFDRAGIIAAIVNSESDNIFLDVIAEADLQKPVLGYLRDNAHGDVVKFFSAVLQTNDHADLVSQLSQVVAPETPQKMLVYAVDDSRMVLNIYRSALHQLGYDFKLFEFPETALQNLVADAPKFVFTDLNMPEISGIDLAAKIRERYSREELPIVMVTTQSESDSRDSALAAGVNAVISKPFNAAALEKAIEANS